MKTNNISGVGIDIVDVARFEVLLEKTNQHLLEKLFTPIEREYCLSFKDAAVHFAGTYAAKEAAHKARQDFSVPLEGIEVRRHESGKPEIWINGEFQNSVLISISHTKETACAIAYNQQI